MAGGKSGAMFAVRMEPDDCIKNGTLFSFWFQKVKSLNEKTCFAFCCCNEDKEGVYERSRKRGINLTRLKKTNKSDNSKFSGSSLFTHLTPR